MIKFYCQHCGTKISAAPTDAGATASCPSCSQELVVPTVITAVTHDLGGTAVATSEAMPDVKGVNANYRKSRRKLSLSIVKFVAVGIPLVVVVVLLLTIIMNSSRENKSSSSQSTRSVTYSYPATTPATSNSSNDNDLVEAGFTKEQIQQLKNTAARTGNSWAETKRMVLKSMYPEEYHDVEREKRRDLFR